jgi:hypothetical protein
MYVIALNQNPLLPPAEIALPPEANGVKKGRLYFPWALRDNDLIY